MYLHCFPLSLWRDCDSNMQCVFVICVASCELIFMAHNSFQALVIVVVAFAITAPRILPHAALNCNFNLYLLIVAIASQNIKD